MDGDQIRSIVVAALVCSTILVGLALQAWVSLRRLRNRPDASNDVAQRLERMERAIDSMAVEIERVGEAHRFTAKLLAERLEPRPAPAHRTPERVVTPH
jgi:hypothetical protein